VYPHTLSPAGSFSFGDLPPFACYFLPALLFTVMTVMTWIGFSLDGKAHDSGASPFLLDPLKPLAMG
jgi:hypothetical protein